VNESEWLAAKHPYDLIYHKACRNDRKRRLLACASARRVLPLAPPSPSFAEVIAVAERYADGIASDADLRAARREVKKVYDALLASMSESAMYAAQAARSTLDKEFMTYKMSMEKAQAAEAARKRPDFDAAYRKEALAQCVLARDIFGSVPFRPLPPLDGAVLTWNDGIIVKLAAAVYEERSLPEGTLDPHRLRVLADALEEAGCTDPDILGHLHQQGGVHVRGCWCVDLLLGK